MMESAWWRTYQKPRRRSSLRTMTVFTFACIIIAAGVGQCVLRDEREMQKDMAPLSESDRSEVVSRWRIEVKP